MTLAIDVGLVGFVRSKHKASACVQGASVTVTRSAACPPLTLTPNRPCVAGPRPLRRAVGAQSKDPLPTLTSPPLPLGRYVLQADLLLQATAAEGFLDAHSTAIFSPEPKELDPWEREHDPFKGEEKDGYGFTTIITATPGQRAPATPTPGKKHLASQKKRRARTASPAGQPPVYR